jgi:hypothetical protein
MKNISAKNKPLTQSMLEILMDCHERELMGLDPCHTIEIRFISPLITRGLLFVNDYIGKNGKEYTACYTTGLARTHLKKLQ